MYPMAVFRSRDGKLSAAEGHPPALLTAFVFRIMQRATPATSSTRESSPHSHLIGRKMSFPYYEHQLTAITCLRGTNFMDLS